MMRTRPRSTLWLFASTAWILAGGGALGAPPIDISGGTGERGLDLVVRDAPIAEVFEMLAIQEEASILVSPKIKGVISVSLFDVSVDQAIRWIAEASGNSVELYRGAYLVMPRDEIGRDHADAATLVRSFKVQYTDPEKIIPVLQKHLSRYGQITSLSPRNLIVVEDLPDFVARIARILDEIDRRPRQILLEAKILEVTLDSTDAFGIDWSQASSFDGNLATVGVRGLTSGSGGIGPGLVFDIVTANFKGFLEALSKAGRLRTLSTPTLLTLEGQEAEVLIGDRLGYRVTTTINQVSTESVEFIDSGVILRFRPSVDREGRILMTLHPEVSTGVVTDGIPSVTTAEVTTQLLADDGQTIFIGGLIKNQTAENRTGVPFLSRIPLFGLLFRRTEWIRVNTETIVLVTPRVVGSTRDLHSGQNRQRVDEIQHFLTERRDAIEDQFDSPSTVSEEDPPSAVTEPPAAPDETGGESAPPAQPDPQDVGPQA